jgi:hypothetical protein
VCAAQYVVYHVSGEVLRQEKGRPQQLAWHSQLGPSQGIVLRPGAQVILLNQQGQQLAYTKPGLTTAEQLRQAFQASQVGPTQAYFAYVWKNAYGHPVTLNQQANAPIGGVSRGDVPTLLAPADSAVLDQPMATFHWSSTESPFLVTVSDSTGNVLLRLTTDATSLELSLSSSRLVPNTIYYWSVTSVSEPVENAPRRACLWASAARQAQFRAIEPPVSPTRLPVAEQYWRSRFKKAWFYTRTK